MFWGLARLKNLLLSSFRLFGYALQQTSVRIAKVVVLKAFVDLVVVVDLCRREWKRIELSSVG